MPLVFGMQNDFKAYVETRFCLNDLEWKILYGLYENVKGPTNSQSMFLVLLNSIKSRHTFPCADLEISSAVVNGHTVFVIPIPPI